MRADVYETRITNDRLCGLLPIATSESVREHSQSWVLQNLNIKSSFLSFIKNNTTEKRCVFSFIYSIGFTGFLQNEFMQHKAHFGLRAVQTALPCKTVR